MRDPDTCRAASPGFSPKAEILEATPKWSSHPAVAPGLIRGLAPFGQRWKEEKPSSVSGTGRRGSEWQLPTHLQS